MTESNRKLAATAVKEGTESAVTAYGWSFENALDQAIRETAAEFGVSEAAITEAVSTFKPWG